MKIAKSDFGEIACPYCGLIAKDGHKLVGIVKCLGCREEFRIVVDRFEDCPGENWPVIERE